MTNSSLTARLSRAAGGATNLQLLLVCIAVLITMSFANPRFLNAYNFESMAFFLPELGILSIAVMIAMLTGVTNWYREGGRLDQDRVVAIYWDLVRGAVGA